MKTLRILSMMLIITAVHFNAFSQKTNRKYAVITIKTSTKCEMCKDRIEKALSFEKGIKKSVVDYKAKTVTVTYSTSKITPDAIRKAITLAGYDADDMPADKKAHDKLPPCCRKGSVDH